MKVSSNCAFHFRLLPVATAAGIIWGTVTMKVEQPSMVADQKAADQPHGHQESRTNDTLQSDLAQSIQSSTSRGVTVRPGTGRLMVTGFAPTVSVGSSS